MEKTKHSGIYSKATKTGEITYAVRFYVPDEKAKSGWRQKQATFSKLQQAIDFKITRGADIKRGEYVAPVNLTVREISEKFLAAKKPHWKEQTYESHEAQVRIHIIPDLGDIKSTSLRPTDIETAAAKWHQKVSAKTVNKIIVTLGAVYKYARKLGVRTNPVLEVEKLKDRPTSEQIEAQALGEIMDYGQDHPERPGHLRAIRPDEVYSSAELNQIIQAANPAYERAFVMTAILTGLRHGELNGLRWSVIDLDKRTLTVNRSLTELKGRNILDTPKTKNAYRKLKLAPELVKALREWKIQAPDKRGLVFVNPLGKPRGRKLNNIMLQRVCERAGVRPLTANALRHSFASQHLIAGTPPLQVSHLMGHATPAITLAIYSKWCEREESKAEMVLADRIFSAEPEVNTGSI
jgi:integrase